MNRLSSKRNKSTGLCNQYKTSRINVIHGPENHQNELHGDGLFSYLRDKKDEFTKKYLAVRPKILDDILEKEGDQIISKIEVCRNPISRKFSASLNFITMGRLKREMEKKGYDNLYHLYMVLTLANGNVYSFEKNQRVNIVKGKKLKPNGECAGALDYGKSTLREFIMNADKLNLDGFYRYNAFSNNCQKWIYDIMNANGITRYNKFILQDVSDLAPSYLERFVQGVTDIAGMIDYKIRGGEYKNY